MLTPEECAVIKERVVPELDRMRSVQRRRAFSGARGQMHPDPAFTALGGLDDAAEAIAALLSTVEALRGELAKAVRVIRDVEWVWMESGGGEKRECPDCAANEYNSKGKHEDGCELSAFLARHGGA